MCMTYQCLRNRSPKTVLVSILNTGNQKISFLQVKMAYHPKSLQFLSVLQIIVGSISVLLGIASAVLITDFTSFVGFGIWVGIWTIIAGILGVFGSRNPQVPNKCLLGTFMGFTITACVMAGTMLACYSIALDALAYKLRCYNLYIMEWYQHRSYYHSNQYDYCGPAYISVSTLKADIGIDSVFIIISILEFATVLASSIYCCAAICRCCNGNSLMQAGQQEVYFPPGMGQASTVGGGMLYTSGVPPGQFIVQRPGQQIIVPVSQTGPIPMQQYVASQTHSSPVAGGVATGEQTAQIQPQKQ